MKLFEPLKPPYDLRIVWVVVPFALLGIALGLMPLRSWDYWYHVAVGRLIASTGEMPMHAHFLYTLPADLPSYVQPWLSQVAFFELHESLGLHRVLVLRTFLGAGAWLFMTLWAARRAGNVPVGAIAALIGLPFGFFCIAARSHLFAWPLFVAIVPLCYAVRERRLPLGALVVLPLAAALWVNLHGSFIIPMLVGVAFTAAELGHLLLGRDVAGDPATRKRVLAFGGATVAAALATLLNPRGAEVYGYLIDLSNNPEVATISEWFPTTPFFPEFYGVYLYVVGVIALGLMFRQRDRVDLVDLFLLLGFCVLAVRASRALLWVGLILPFVLPPYVAFLKRYFVADEKPPSTASQAINVVVASMLVLAVFAVQPWGPDHAITADVQPVPTRAEPPLRGLVPAQTPVEAVQQLEAVDDLRLFHDNQTPGFLIYWLDDADPDQLVFLDNRVELPTAEIWERYYQTSDGESWRETFAEYDVNAVVASLPAQQGLVDAMRDAEGWQLRFENEYYLLFVRADR